MSGDALLRTIAVVVAVAILAAPYRAWMVAAIEACVDWVRENSAGLGRFAAAALIVAAAWGKVPMPAFPVVRPAVTVEIKTPDADMQAAVAPIASALRSLPIGSRMTWAATWQKAALVIEGEGTAKDVSLTDTRSLQAFTALALDIAWRRIDGNAPGSNEPLRRAVESAYGSAMGRDDVPVSADVRDRFAKFARAVAWAGLNGG